MKNENQNNSIKNFKEFINLNKNIFKIEILDKKNINKSTRLFILKIQNRFIIKIILKSKSRIYKFYPNNDNYFIISDNFHDFINLLDYFKKIKDIKL